MLKRKTQAYLNKMVRNQIKILPPDDKPELEIYVEADLSECSREEYIDTLERVKGKKAYVADSNFGGTRIYRII
tara:strand:+ start:1279 stop:1500 length:222 start_codon:yes stop_codon:yes gene_type:complete